MLSDTEWCKLKAAYVRLKKEMQSVFQLRIGIIEAVNVNPLAKVKLQKTQ